MKTNTNTQYLEKLISEGEHIHQDFKFAISDARKIAKSLSAFANTEGGRLLVGVKDNGKIAGVRSEEELYMIEAAANLYCRPEVELDTRIYHVDGKDVLEVQVNESQQKPIYALDEENRPWAYVRIKDENILANPIHLNILEARPCRKRRCHDLYPAGTAGIDDSATACSPYPGTMQPPYPYEPETDQPPACRLYPLRSGRATLRGTYILFSA